MRWLTFWLVLILTAGRVSLLRRPVTEPELTLVKPEKKRNQPIPPLREEWFTDPALKREMKREF